MGNLCAGAKNAAPAEQNIKHDISKIMETPQLTTVAKQKPKEALKPVTTQTKIVKTSAPEQEQIHVSVKPPQTDIIYEPVSVSVPVSDPAPSPVPEFVPKAEPITIPDSVVTKGSELEVACTDVEPEDVNVTLKNFQELKAEPMAEQVTLHADSLIVYEEVMEQNPENDVGNAKKLLNQGQASSSGDEKTLSGKNGDNINEQMQSDQVLEKQKDVKSENHASLGGSSDPDPEELEQSVTVVLPSIAEHIVSDQQDVCIDNEDDLDTFEQEMAPESIQPEVQLGEAVSATADQASLAPCLPFINFEQNDVDQVEVEDIVNQAIQESKETAAIQLQKEMIDKFLAKHNLTEVQRLQLRDGSTRLNDDYFLRLTNCIFLISQQSLKAYTADALRKRREAHKAQNWEEYGEIAEQIGNQKQIMHESVLRDVCSALGVDEQEFIETHVEVSQSERSEDLYSALKGELYANNDEDLEQGPRPTLTEDQVLEIFEFITRDGLLQQQKTQEMTEDQDENEILKEALISGARQMDAIFFDYGVEIEEFQAASRFFLHNSPDFERKLVQKEAEIMQGNQ